MDYRQPVTARECSSMVRNSKSPDGYPLIRLSEGLFSTNRSREVDWVWTGTNVDDTIDYYYQNTKLTVSNSDQTIISMKKLIEACRYDKGSCKGEDGVLVWSTTELDETCRLIKSETTTCLITGSTMSCPTVNAAVTTIESTTLCHLEVGYSSQGLIFTQDKENSLATNIVTAQVLLDAIADRDNSKRNRRRI